MKDTERLQGNLNIKLFRKFKNNEMKNIAEDIIDRMDKQTFEEIYNCIDESLIYTDDQWEVLKHYFSINELTENSFNEAIEQLAEDIAEVLGINE